tara:strand:+ start:2287 stop:2430 length:144 start_codon:yes stop_codon:yes gene_type:complete
MRLARELGYTLAELGERMTKEELELWCVLYEVEAQEQDEARRKAKRR